MSDETEAGGERELLSVTEQLDRVESNDRILAIDDDQAVLDFYREIFQPEREEPLPIWNVLNTDENGEDTPTEPPRYDLTTAESGEVGLEYAQWALTEQKPFSVALIDMRMPGGMNGLETAQKLRELDPRIMVVIITAYSDHRLEEIQQRLLYDVLFLNKPISSDEALQTVRMLNQNWKAREKSKVLEMQMVSNARMASLGSMAVRIAHEINQPLSYINGMLQIQKMELEGERALDPAGAVEEIELALEQTVRIKEIIDSLRVFAHPDKRHRDQLSLAEAIKHVERIYQKQLEASQIKFTVQLAEDLPSLHANASQLQRILINLTSNAIDALQEAAASKKPGWQAEIDLQARYLADKHAVEVIFSDNGCGIPESIEDRMFDPFVTTKEPGKGTGLGLSEIHGMLRDHGATIEYQTVMQGGGARFIILFPLESEAD